MIVSSSSDWITLTETWSAREMEDRAKGGETLLQGCFKAIALCEEDWGTMGYQGLQCTETKIRYGTREERTGGQHEILTGSGQTSDEVVDFMPVQNSLRCTRFDLQATVYLPSPDVDIAGTLYHSLMREKYKGVSKSGRRALSLIQSDTGQTLYVGKRKSGRKFFRLYDKSVELQAPLGTVWRQEIQYGREFAQNAWEWFKVHRFDMSAHIKMVNTEFTAAIDYSMMSDQGYTSEVIPEVIREKGTIGSKLSWLRRCVRPVVAFLGEKKYGQEAVEALGLASEKGGTEAIPQEEVDNEEWSLYNR